jgi:hypothetical protein
MRIFARHLSVFSLVCFALGFAARINAQDPPTQPPGQTQSGQDGSQQGGGRNGERRPGVFGKITAINGQSIQVATPRGETITVKITADTQFRKDRETAKLSDLKVGDTVGVRGTENPDHTWTAQMVGSRPNGGFGGGGPNGAPGGGQAMRQPLGVLGQDYVAGEVKSVDAPKLTILRTDNVTQTIELNEETSLRKGRDSVTMADIQPGDHVFVRGASANNVFQPKSVMVIGPEQWKRMQENGMTGAGGKNGQPPSTPPGSQPQNPPEQPH